MCVSASSCQYVYGVYAVPMQGQKMAYDPLDLELQATLNCHIAAENQIKVLGKSRKNSLLLNPFSSFSIGYS